MRLRKPLSPCFSQEKGHGIRKDRARSLLEEVSILEFILHLNDAQSCDITVEGSCKYLSLKMLSRRPAVSVCRTDVERIFTGRRTLFMG